MKNPLIVRQMSAQAAGQGQQRIAQIQRPVSAPTQLTAMQLPLQSTTVRLPHTTSAGEIPKKIEQSELSPSTELDVESDL